MSTEPHGVIHDIGYRHFEGRRLGRGYITRSLFAESAKGAYGLGRSARTKVLPMLLLAAITLPALVIVVIATVMGAPELPTRYDTYALNLQVVVAVFVAAQAPVVVSRDLRFRVVSLYFSRPIERVDYVNAKYAAMVAAVLVLLATPLTVMFVGALLAGMDLGDQVGEYARAMVGAVLLAMLVGGIAILVAAVTPRRGLGVAAVISVLLVLIGVQEVVNEVAAEVGAETASRYSGLISPFTLVDGATRRLLGGLPPEAGPPGTIGGLVFALVLLLLVAACYGGLLARYRRVSVS